MDKIDIIIVSALIIASLLSFNSYLNNRDLKPYTASSPVDIDKIINLYERR